jgi:hypothetical protein
MCHGNVIGKNPLNSVHRSDSYLFRHGQISTNLAMSKQVAVICYTETHDLCQWLLLQFNVLLVMDVRGIRNMYRNIAVK